MAVYKSRIGFWAYLYLAFFIFLTGYFWLNGDLTAGIIFTVVTTALFWSFFNVRYIITEKELLIKPFGPSVPLKDITEIEASGKHHFMAAPALSLKRLMIRYKGSDVFISPEKEERFVEELKERCGNLPLLS